MFKKLIALFSNPYRYGYKDETGTYISQRSAVLSYIRDNHGCTREDVHKALKIRKASATGRIAELRAFLTKDAVEVAVVHCGEKYVRATRTANAKLTVSSQYV